MADDGAQLVAQVAELQPQGSLKPEICDALRSLPGFHELYDRQYRHVVIGFFLQGYWKTKLGQKRRRRGSDLVMNICERNEELTTN